MHIYEWVYKFFSFCIYSEKLSGNIICTYIDDFISFSVFIMRLSGRQIHHTHNMHTHIYNIYAYCICVYIYVSIHIQMSTYISPENYRF